MENNFKESLVGLSRSKIVLAVVIFGNIMTIILVILSLFACPLGITFFFITVAFVVNIILHTFVQIRKRNKKFIQINKLTDIIMSSYAVVSGILYCIFILPCLWVAINIDVAVSIQDYIQTGLCWFAIKNILALFITHEFKRHLKK